MNMTPAERPSPLEGSRHLVLVVLDSLRYDSAMAAGMANLGRLGPIERRWSYASWTAPSHYNMLMGLLPHSSPRGVFASEYYKHDFVRYQERLGAPGIEFRALLPSIYFPTYLKWSLGYSTGALVSLPVLNPAVPLNRDFDVYELMPRHNDMRAMLERIRFDGGRPWLWLLNVGETHYPYALPDEDPSEWPRISGVHGTFKHLDDLVVGGRLRESTDPSEKFFDERMLDLMRGRQIRAANYVDGVIGLLFDVVPENTWVIVTADHGEMFGEEGYFGHGPVAHETVHEVPFVEGRLR